jgi:hypothetical protein
MSSESGARVGPDSRGRRAWKFLAPGAIAPFSGHVWPLPIGGRRAEWVESAREGVYACRLADLPWWVDAELWEVELRGPWEDLPTQVRARAARLVTQRTAWDASALRAYGEASAFRARDWAVEALLAEQRAADAEALGACRTLAEVAERARVLQGLSRAGNLAGYAADAAARAGLGNAGAAANMAGNASILHRGTRRAFDAERAWQSAWIAARAGLPPDDPS